MKGRSMENKIFGRPATLNDAVTHYCPGCSHGIGHRLVAEVIDDLGVRGSTILVSPVGCSGLIDKYMNLDTVSALHGRAPAVATGVKRAFPGKTVFTYQGDGDLAAIGTAEIIHAASRGENITVVFLNNAIYGMTGGQMAPTTILDQVTQTTPAGRTQARAGNPVHVSEMLATLDGPAYIARVSLHDPRHVLQAKKAIRKAFDMQMQKRGFSLVEMLGSCPTNWKMSPQHANRWIASDLLPVYPLGVFKDVAGKEAGHDA
jgi:2-oxoglutarate ferredoxin oxidoreductase subunit beta